MKFLNFQSATLVMIFFLVSVKNSSDSREIQKRKRTSDIRQGQIFGSTRIHRFKFLRRRPIETGHKTVPESTLYRR